MTLEEFLEEWKNSDIITVHTSGSTGSPKLLKVEKHRMEASALATCDFLGLKAGDTALLCMPLDYIAGKMMVVRAIVRGLRLVSVKPSGHPLATLSEPPVFAAMTPMQVAGCLEVAYERRLLEGIQHLLIGGGAIDESLERELRTMPGAIWSSYGMTETLSHIALRRVNGPDADSWYMPLKGVSVSAGDDGCLVIDAPRVCAETLHTHDLVEFAPDGKRFRIIGRKDNVICSGGIKIQIEAVEDLLRRHLSVPFAVTWRHDTRLGEAVTLLFEGVGTDVEAMRETCCKVLPRYWRPRHYIPVDHIPITATGKPARAEAHRIAQDAAV